MAFILLFSLFASQFLILYWKKKHYRSYQAVSLSGLYFFPVLFGLREGWYRFITVWVIYSLLNGFGTHFLDIYIRYAFSHIDLIHLQFSTRHLAILLEQWRHAWFTSGILSFTILRLSSVCSAMLSSWSFSLESPRSSPPNQILCKLVSWHYLTVFILGMLYTNMGLKFTSWLSPISVLGRDFVEICSDRMASTIGYYSKDGLPQKHLNTDICAVCGQATSSTGGTIIDPQQHAFTNDEVHQLACKHKFHEKCIRGWCLIGKKDICPYW